MSTREHLRARVLRLSIFGLPLFLVLLTLAPRWRQSALLNMFVLVVVAINVATYTVFMRRTPCLRCGLPLGNVALNWGSKRAPAPRCPNCGLGIDEQTGSPQSTVTD